MMDCVFEPVCRGNVCVCFTDVRMGLYEDDGHKFQELFV